ncbi:MAG TPA: tRNA (cytidine(34)-2'-O)-methyltransferase [Alphaproteobacteria bacterium]|nr:tRNA (cytidine(34)-2'-O)-methyltransferase [Alphaproteobacteria bacterium]
MRIALFEPDIPQNTGAVLRLAACLGVDVDIIEPCGFVLDNKRLKRVGMDYLKAVDLTRHASWARFVEARAHIGDGGRSVGRLVLLTTAAETAYQDFRFARDDVLLCGRESAGVPAEIHDAADARIKVPMAHGARSLNVAMAAAIVLGEALRQTGQLPGLLPGESA